MAEFVAPAPLLGDPGSLDQHRAGRLTPAQRSQRLWDTAVANLAPAVVMEAFAVATLPSAWEIRSLLGLVELGVLLMLPAYATWSIVSSLRDLRSISRGLVRYVDRDGPMIVKARHASRSAGFWAPMPRSYPRPTRAVEIAPAGTRVRLYLIEGTNELVNWEPLAVEA